MCNKYRWLPLLVLPPWRFAYPVQSETHETRRRENAWSISQVHTRTTSLRFHVTRVLSVIIKIDRVVRRVNCVHSVRTQEPPDSPRVRAATEVRSFHSKVHIRATFVQTALKVQLAQ